MPDNSVPEWARNLLLVIQREWHPFAVWEKTDTGQVLRTFPDEYLAGQFVLNNGGEVTPNPTFKPL